MSTRTMDLAAAVLLAAFLMAAPDLPGVGLVEATSREFGSPAEAVTALIHAIRADDKNALLAILGPEAKTLVSSGDPVADKNAGERLAADYDRAHRLEGGGGKVILYVGADDFPFAIPLVPDGPLWRFDTAAGKDEILNRRIGKNELEAIQVCLAYVDAQREYYATARNTDGIREYSRRLGSTPGKRDGLFWSTKPGDPPSPLGPLLARARGEGYGKGQGGKPAPYHGYYYRILTAQGPGAPGGAYDYLARGRMIGGFALVAFPAQYGVSGVMTFMVNHDGVVYQKDLGPNTAALAEAIKQFNPDAGWTKA
jgi:hypothetical protein